MKSQDDGMHEAVLMIEALCHAELPAEGMARLEELLLTDAAVLQFYVGYMQMHASLPQFTGCRSLDTLALNGQSANALWHDSQIAGGPERKPAEWGRMKELGHLSPSDGLPSECDFRPGKAVVETSQETNDFSPRVLPTRGSSPGKPVSSFALRASALLGLASSLLIIVLVCVVGKKSLDGIGARSRDGGFPFATEDGASTNQIAALSPTAKLQPAVLVAARNCRWVGGACREGQGLAVGRPLKLESGLAEIEFACGARAILQSPATFEIRSSNAMMLQNGRLSARMAIHRGQRFIVHTPRADVLDLGTEFGVDVDPQFNTLVKVFSGEVTLSPIASGQPLHLTANQAAQFDSRLESASTLVTINVPHFVKSLPPVAGIVADGLIEHLDAGQGVTANPASAQVARWANLAAEGGDSVSQLSPPRQPFLLAKAAAGLPALAFNGRKSLAGTNGDAFRFTQGFTWFAVVEPDPVPGTQSRNNFFFGTLSNVDGQWLGLAAGFDVNRSPFAFLRPATALAAGDESQYVLGSIGAEGPHVFACRLDPSMCTATFHIDGEEDGRQSNPYWGTRFDGGPLAVGIARTQNHAESFSGRIYEILLYNRPLLTEERTAIERYLLRKYNLR
jgi:hypothetical protein